MMLNVICNAQFEKFFWARPLPETTMLVIFIAVVVVSIYLYRRPWGLKPWLRTLLGFARLAVLALLVAMLFEPTAVMRETHTEQRGLPVLIDVSESMSIKDQRKRQEDLAEAALALNLLPEDADQENVALQLDTKQRSIIASSTRLDLAKSMLSNSAAKVFDSIADEVDVSYHTFIH